MPENFVYGVDFTDDRRCPVKPGMTRKEREDDKGVGYARRSPPEPALSKAEWARMTKRGRGDDSRKNGDEQQLFAFGQL